MRWFRLLWLVHRWLGVAAGLVLVLTAATGFLLLLKKDFAWIQPPVVVGAPGSTQELQPLQAVIGAVVAMGLPQFRSESDIDRIDFRPGKRVHKVISVRDHAEVQVCAITLRATGPERRVSDWLESLHDGSVFGAFAHSTVMPTVALILLYLAGSGYVMWLWPKWQQLRKRRLRSEPLSRPAAPAAPS